MGGTIYTHGVRSTIDAYGLHLNSTYSNEMYWLGTIYETDVAGWDIWRGWVHSRE
jgi:hypothetical protein